MGIVEYETSDGIATITLNRPDTLNAMTEGLMVELTDAFARVESDNAIRVVVLTGAGRGFCSGADLSAVSSGETGSAGPDSMDTVFNPAILAVANCPVPTVGRINGVAAGGGFGLAMTCDISIAARSAFFVSTFGPRLGIVPDLGTSWHLPLRAGSARARGIAMLGGRITADQAAEWGLIWDVVGDDVLDAAIGQVTTMLKRSSPNAMTRIRSALAQAEHNTLAEQLDLEYEHQSALIPLNMSEGAKAFMEKRDPVFSSARQQAGSEFQHETSEGGSGP
jgi:2-(1,2-epoxy-1,2-dihydrophenyl)acetyl-CoA isomerase